MLSLLYKLLYMISATHRAVMNNSKTGHASRIIDCLFCVPSADLLVLAMHVAVAVGSMSLGTMLGSCMTLAMDSLP